MPSAKELESYQPCAHFLQQLAAGRFKISFVRFERATGNFLIAHLGFDGQPGIAYLQRHIDIGDEVTRRGSFQQFKSRSGWTPGPDDLTKEILNQNLVG